MLPQCCLACAGCTRRPGLQRGMGGTVCVSEVSWPVDIHATGDRHVMNRDREMDVFSIVSAVELG